MAMKRAILVLEFDDEAGNFDTVGEIGQTVHGCIEDMAGESFPELSIHGFASVEELTSEIGNGLFGVDPEFAPLQAAPKRKR